MLSTFCISCNNRIITELMVIVLCVCVAGGSSSEEGNATQRAAGASRAGTIAARAGETKVSIAVLCCSSMVPAMLPSNETLSSMLMIGLCWLVETPSLSTLGVTCSQNDNLMITATCYGSVVD